MPCVFFSHDHLSVSQFFELISFLLQATNIPPSFRHQKVTDSKWTFKPSNLVCIPKEIVIGIMFPCCAVLSRKPAIEKTREMTWSNNILERYSYLHDESPLAWKTLAHILLLLLQPDRHIQLLWVLVFLPREEYLLYFTLLLLKIEKQNDKCHSFCLVLLFGKRKLYKKWIDVSCWLCSKISHFKTLQKL